MPKLETLMEDPKAIRSRTRSKHTGPLRATELLKYLGLEEKAMTDWESVRAGYGTGKKGRPKKGTPKKVKAPRPVSSPRKTLADAKKGKLLPPRKGTLTVKGKRVKPPALRQGKKVKPLKLKKRK